MSQVNLVISLKCPKQRNTRHKGDTAPASHLSPEEKQSKVEKAGTTQNCLSQQLQFTMSTSAMISGLSSIRLWPGLIYTAAASTQRSSITGLWGSADSKEKVS